MSSSSSLNSELLIDRGICVKKLTSCSLAMVISTLDLCFFVNINVCFCAEIMRVNFFFFFILRVSAQNGVSPLYIMLEIHHSGWEPLDLTDQYHCVFVCLFRMIWYLCVFVCLCRMIVQYICIFLSLV